MEKNEFVEDLAEYERYWGPRIRAILLVKLQAVFKREKRKARNLKNKANGGFHDGPYKNA